MNYEDFDSNEFQRALFKHVMDNGHNWGDTQTNKIKKYSTFNKYLMVIKAAFKDILTYESQLPTLYQKPFKFEHLKKVDEPSGKDKLKQDKAKRINEKNIHKVYARMLENYMKGNTKARGSDTAAYMTNKLDLHWRLLIETALRKSEAIALKWSDLSLKEANNQKIGLLHIERQWNNIVEDFTPLKNKKERTVSLSYEFYKELMELKKSQPEIEKTNDLMFPNTNGDIDKRDTLYKSLYNANKSLFGSLDEGGKDWVRPHDLRHYHATSKLKNGANLQLVSKTLGHSDQKITASIYVQDYDINIEEQLAYNQI
jgi:integrase